MRYIAELERKVQTLQTEATSLSAQLTLLQVAQLSFLLLITDSCWIVAQNDQPSPNKHKMCTI